MQLRTLARAGWFLGAIATPAWSAPLTDDDIMIASAPPIAVPAGYGTYCSMSYPAGGWSFAWGTATADPWAPML
jgi:hypothetical protein